MSEPLPKRQKLKTTTACEPCRSRKIRCDGNKPSCEACLKRNQQCIYQATPDVKSANAYVDSLVNRVSQLEHELNNARNTILRLSTAPPPVAPTPPPPTLPPHPDSNIDPRLFPDYGAPNPRPASVDAMGGDAGFDERPVDGQPFYGSSSAHGFTQQMYGGILQKDDTTAEPEIPIDPALMEPVANLSAPPASYSAPENFSLLPRELADHLMHLYWVRVHLLYPFLHKSSFQKAYEDLWKPTSQHHQHYRSSSGLGLGAAEEPRSPVFHCALNAALALGMQFSDLPLNEKERISAACLAKSKDLLKMDLFDDGNLSLVQTLLLLTQYFQSTNWPSKCWTSIGLACRLAQGLGLHVEKVRPGQNELSTDEHEMRRRVWHGCVTLDIVVSMTLGRPAMLLGSKARSLPIPLASGEESLPTMVDDKIQPSSIDFFVETVKLYRIVGRILLNIYRINDEQDERSGAAEDDRNDEMTKELDNELTRFADKLPETLKWLRPKGDHVAADLLERQSHVLHVRFLHARILLFQPVFLSTCRSHGSKPGSNGMAKHTISIFEPVQTAIELIDAVRAYSATEATGAWWYNVFYTRTAAMVILLAGTCPPIFESVGEEAWQQAWTNCVEILTKNLPQYAPVKTCLKTLAALRNNVLRQRSAGGFKDTKESPQNASPGFESNVNGQNFDPFEFVESDLFSDFGFDFTQPLY
jgi:hypothetical protein